MPGCKPVLALISIETVDMKKSPSLWEGNQILKRSHKLLMILMVVLASFAFKAEVARIPATAQGPSLFNLQPITPDNVDQIEQLAALEQRTVCNATFSPDGRLLASSGIREVVLQDVVSGSVLDTLPTRHTDVFRNIAFSPDGRLIAAPSTGNCGSTSVQVWDVASKKLLLQRLGGFEHMATSVAFSPDGRLIAVGTGCAFDVAGSATVKVWNIESGMLVLDIPVPHFVRDVEFSPDGTLLAAASSDGVVRLWDVQMGTLRGELQGHNEGVSAVVFSPDGTKLASGGADVRLWDVASGEQIYLFEALPGEAVDIAFSVDGQLLVTGGGRHTLVFWDTATGTALAQREVSVEDNYVYSVAFNPDNTLLATCEHNNMLRLWGIPEK